MKLLTKFVLATISIFLILAVAIAAVSINWINKSTINDAQHRVELTMRSARDLFSEKTRETHQLLEIMAQNEMLREFLEYPSNQGLSLKITEKLRSFRLRHDLDILNLISTDGTILKRTRPPWNSGDDVSDDPLIKQVLLSRKSSEGALILNEGRLSREGSTLLETCIDMTGEPRGMFSGVAVPVFSEDSMIGIIAAGILLNGNNSLIDSIRDAVSTDDFYNGRSLGTATIFMGDKRIATNVVGSREGRATGTRASMEVADQVLLRGKPWKGRAWVVDAWYLSQYEPIHDPDGETIGMFYVGELEEKYRDIRFNAVSSVVGVIFGGMLIAILVFTFMAWTILVPVKKLRDVTMQLIDGDRSARVHEHFSAELGDLTLSFNKMADEIESHTEEIEKKQKELKALNSELEQTNRNYIDMLGFVSHELKNPLASAVMSLHTVKGGYIGGLNEKQQSALDSVAESLDYFKDMIKNYLDLSKLEKGEYTINRRKTFLKSMVIDPVISSLSGEILDKHMTLDIGVHDDVEIDADPDLMRIVYDNLISNAVKYGRDGGAIRLKHKIRENKNIFSVYNDGAGIPQEKMYLLFKKFSRIYTPENAEKKGTGLGLYTCREIIRKHGGTIWAESEPENWVEFSFEIG